MIDAISIHGFKSLRSISLELGALNIFIGTNASGKSNFFDALRVVQGIGLGYTINEIFDGKPGSAGGEAWEPVRGGSANASFREWNPEHVAVTGGPIHFTLELSPPDIQGPIEYSIELAASAGRVIGEKLTWRGSPVFDTAPVENSLESPNIGVRYYTGNRGGQPHLQLESGRPALPQIARHRQCSPEHVELIQAALRDLAAMQRLDPSPAVLREYSRWTLARRIGERGENFAALVKSILQTSSAADGYTAWLRQLTPPEMDRVEILTGAVGEPLFALQMDQQTFAAPVLSDGTLRFAAIAAAFYQLDAPGLLLIEEIEKSIHPTRLRLLLELLKSHAHRPSPQVIATTHSPIVLSWLREEDYDTVFFCSRDAATGESVILPLSQVPRFLEIVQRQPIADLFSEGWLEGAL